MVRIRCELMPGGFCPCGVLSSIDLPYLDGLVPTSSGENRVWSVHPANLADGCIVLGDLC